MSFHVTLGCQGHLQTLLRIVTAPWLIGFFLSRPFASLYRVIVGAHNLYEGTTHTVSRLVYHPMFNRGLPPRSNDIAIIRLSTPVNITSPRVGLVCMPTSYLSGAGGRECVVTGWGRISEGEQSCTVCWLRNRYSTLLLGGPPSIRLQEVKVPIYDNSVCNSYHYYPGLIGPTMVCAGWDEGGKDSCQVSLSDFVEASVYPRFSSGRLGRPASLRCGRSVASSWTRQLGLRMR